MAKAQREDTAPAHEIKYVVAEDTARGQFHQGGLVRKEFCRLLIGPIGCVSGDTEFLSPTGWKRIDEWDGEDIAQWSPDGYLSWVKPEYHRGPATEPLYRFHKDHMSMVLSGEHRVPVYDWDGKFAVKTAERLAAKRSRHTLPTTFTVPQTGPLCSEWWVRLLVAMEADGSRPKAGRQSIFTFRKERKKERIEWLLNLNGLSWKKREYPQRPTETTYVVQTRLPKTRYTDRFWWGLSSTELEWVVDEMVHWDGHRSSHTFFSSGHKCAVDFMQFAAHATGRKATIRAIQPRKGNEKVHYTAIVSEKGGVKSRTQVRSDDPPIERVPCAEQFCFTVPTSFWLARHNGFVFATGNSGKSVASIMDFFMLASSMPKLRDGFRHSRWAFIRNTGPQLRDTTLKTYMDWFPEPQFGQFRRTEKIFNFQYGDVKAEILFKALDDPGDVRNLLSLELTGAFLNEAREIDPSIWEGVTGRVGRYPSFAKLKQVLPWSHEPPDRPGRWLRWSRKKHNAPSRVTEHYVRLTDGVLTADVDLVRDLDYKWAEGPWAGIIADTNPCSTDDFIYKLFEVQAKQDPQVGELYHIYHQPPGLLRADNRWVTNPNAENIENLPPGYYTKAAVGKDKSWIDVYCLGKYGVLSDGKPVHAGYDDSWHCCEFDFDPSLPVYVGWDFGITGQACVLAQLSRRGQLRVFDEFFAEDVGMYSFARDVVKPGLAKWKGAKFEMSFGDPAGNNRSASDEKAAMEVLNDAYEGLEVRLPFKTYPTHTNAARPRWDAVDFFLNNNTLKQAQEPVAPRFLIHPRCTLLRQGLQGRYEFERVRGTDGRYKEVPKKNRHSHCFVGETLVATPDGDRRIDGLRPGDTVLSHLGPRRVLSTMCRTAPTVELRFEDGRVLRCTPDHSFPTDRGRVRADELQYADILYESASCPETSTQFKSTTGLGSTGNPPATTRPSRNPTGLSTRTVGFGKMLSALFRRVGTFTTKTATVQTIDWRTWKRLAAASIFASIWRSAPRNSVPPRRSTLPFGRAPRPPLGTPAMWVGRGMYSTPSESRRSKPSALLSYVSAIIAARSTLALSGYGSLQTSSVPQAAKGRFASNPAWTTKPEPVACARGLSEQIATGRLKRAPRLVGRSRLAEVVVYDVTVGDAHTFFAEGVLTYNCADALQYLCLGTISHNDWRPENEREDEDDAMPVRRVARTASYSGY